MPDFNQQAPPADVTNPDKDAAKGAPYPAHLYRLGEKGPSVVVAWDGERPIRNEIVEVASAAEEAAKVKAGWSTKPVLSAKSA